MIDIQGNDFYEQIKELGEKVTFTETGVVQYASIKPNMLNKAIGTTDGAYWYTGVMTFDDMDQQEKFSGAYFKRETQPNSTLMLYSVFPENSTPKVAITHCVECNEKVDIVSHYEDTGKINNYGEAIMRPVYAYKDVDVYYTTYTKEARDTLAGSMQETITYIMLPAKYALSSKNRIMKDTFVYDEVTHTNKLEKKPYQVESADTSLMDIMYEGGEQKLVGIVKYLLKEAQEENDGT